jgi:hypothetical protein
MNTSWLRANLINKKTSSIATCISSDNLKLVVATTGGTVTFAANTLVKEGDRVFVENATVKKIIVKETFYV